MEKWNDMMLEFALKFFPFPAKGKKDRWSQSRLLLNWRVYRGLLYCLLLFAFEIFHNKNVFKVYRILMTTFWLACNF